MEQNIFFSKIFKQTFHINDIQHNIVVKPFITKPIPTIHILNCNLRKKDKYTRINNTALTVFQKLNKQRPFFSNFQSVCNQERKYLKPLSGYVYNFSIIKVHQNNMHQNEQWLYRSDLEFKPIHKFFRIIISSIKYTNKTK